MLRSKPDAISQRWHSKTVTTPASTSGCWLRFVVFVSQIQHVSLDSERSSSSRALVKNRYHLADSTDTYHSLDQCDRLPGTALPSQRPPTTPPHPTLCGFPRRRPVHKPFRHPRFDKVKLTCRLFLFFRRLLYDRVHMPTFETAMGAILQIKTMEIWWKLLIMVNNFQKHVSLQTN